jgi:hypothetical protein
LPKRRDFALFAPRSAFFRRSFRALFRSVPPVAPFDFAFDRRRFLAFPFLFPFLAYFSFRFYSTERRL